MRNGHHHPTGGTCLEDSRSQPIELSTPGIWVDMDMDLKVAGQCLFDNICQQFELVCKDVDDIVNHDSIKYIEQKVQSVGENVMKLYSKLGQMLASPREDLVINEAEDEVNEQEYDAALKLMMISDEVSAQTTTDKQYSTDSEETAFETSASECFSCTSSAFDIASSASMPIPSDATSSTIIRNETLAEMGNNLFSNEDFTFYLDGTESPSFIRAIQNEIIDIMKWSSDYYSSQQIDSFGNRSSSVVSSLESSGLSDNDSCEATDFDKEAKNLSHQMELEESCVIVDYSTPHHDVSCEAQNQHSYKEKILGALSSKKRLEREYKELANLHSDNATKCFQGTNLPAPSEVLLRDSQTVHLSGSEWELL